MKRVRHFFADEIRKTFVFALDHIFLCELGNSHSSVALILQGLSEHKLIRAKKRL